MKWRLFFRPYINNRLFSPAGSYLYLELMKMPNIAAKVHVNMELKLLETKTSFTRDKKFTKAGQSATWDDDCLSHLRIRGSKTFTFQVGLTVISVLDKNGDDITHNFVKTEQKVNEKQDTHAKQQQNSLIIDQMKRFDAKLNFITDQIVQLSKSVMDIKQTVDNLKQIGDDEK